MIGSRDIFFYSKEQIRRVRLVRRADGYYCQFGINTDAKEDVEPTQQAIGLDLGLTDFYTDSNGHKEPNPRFFRQGEEELKRCQRRLSRKQIPFMKAKRRKVECQGNRICLKKDDNLKKKLESKSEILKLLCLSNGHGEDVIAVRILEALRQRDQSVEISALPIVGDGLAYQRSRIRLITPGKTMPSGGFIYMDAKELWRDVRGGLIGLTLAQLKAVRHWAKSGGLILAVGDIVPLLFAGLSGSQYLFVGTAKSEYYLRDESGWLKKTSVWERTLGSVYLPWERWLMKTRRCRGVFPRDRLTTQVLQPFGIPAYDFGNPMMDAIIPEVPILEPSELQRSLRILLLPGSRSPEAERNWQLILEAVEPIIQGERKRRLSFFSAIAPSLELDPFCEALQARGWQHPLKASRATVIQDEQGLTFQQGMTPLLLTQTAYHSCLLAADLAIAMAGTATEQFVGLGKPVIAFPGTGPQYTPAFAEAQTRLLGASVILVKTPSQAAAAFQNLLSAPDRLQQIAEKGRQRMGPPGASARIADYILNGET